LLQNESRKILTRKIGLTAVLAAVAVVLSPIVSVPLGFAKPFPIQHMVNAIAGVLLGPWYAVLVALVAGTVRNILGSGSVHAFPGGIFGALVVGLVNRYLFKSDYAALTEPIGTGLIGAVVSAYLVGPWALSVGLLTSLPTVDVFIILFLTSSIPGSILGLVVLKIIRRAGVWPES
jgi:energy coupling factor transporter S component ThiW